MSIRSWLRRLRERRREKIADEYGYLSDAERAELEEMRHEHDPLGEAARTRGRFGRMPEDEFDPPGR